MTDDLLLKPKQAAKLLSMSIPWVYRAAEKGILPCVRYPSIGESGRGAVRFRLGDLQAFIEENYKKAI